MSNVSSAVTLKDIEKIFAVLERVGVSREAVVIPLRLRTPGGVRRLADGRLEIVVDGSVALDDWLPTLEQQIEAQVGQQGGG